jgi:hypothetical protein
VPPEGCSRGRLALPEVEARLSLLAQRETPLKRRERVAPCDNDLSGSADRCIALSTIEGLQLDVDDQGGIGAHQTEVEEQQSVHRATASAPDLRRPSAL